MFQVAGTIFRSACVDVAQMHNIDTGAMKPVSQLLKSHVMFLHVGTPGAGAGACMNRYQKCCPLRGTYSSKPGGVVHRGVELYRFS